MKTRKNKRYTDRITRKCIYHHDKVIFDTVELAEGYSLLWHSDKESGVYACPNVGGHFHVRDLRKRKIKANKKKPKRKPCPETCECECHKNQGRSNHPNEPCPGKRKSVD